MNSDILHEFRPDTTDHLYMWIGILIALAAFLLTYYFLRQPQKGREHTKAALIAMLFFFTGLMASGTAFFSGWSLLKQGKVILEQKQMQIGQSTIPYQQINKIYYKKDKQSSIFQAIEGSTTITFLVIEEKGGRTHALSEEQFPIGEIRSRLEEIFATNKPN